MALPGGAPDRRVPAGRGMAAEDSRDGLVERAVRGDEAALTELLEVTGPQVRAGLAVPESLRAVLSADDVLQETYTDAWLHVGSLRERSVEGFRAWLARLARNNLLDARKLLLADKRGGNRRRVRGGSEEDSLLGLHERVQAGSRTPSAKAVRRELCERMREALDQLRGDHRRAVELYDLQGRPIEEVAEALGRSPGAVYMLRARALDGLRAALGRSSKYTSRFG